MKLGIVPERIQPAHPEQNGRHERMHLTLQQETMTAMAANRRAQQRRFDQSRREYNHERPHESLAMQTPAACYAPSPRAYPARVPEPEYGTAMIVRRVQASGEFSWEHEDVFLARPWKESALHSKPSTTAGTRSIFADFPLAQFDRRTRTIRRLRPAKAFYIADAGEEEPPPSPAPHPQNPDQKTVNHVPRSKMSIICRLDKW